jgi:hypothetical protein
MGVCKQLLTLEHYWSISAGSCLTSTDLAPGDYHLFTYIKNWLGSQHFINNEELMEGVRTWLSSQVADFFDIGIQKLIPKYDRCLNSSDDCIEK